ncbi:MAG TPA: hypothetical protein VG674_27515 [Amycolatopsis sp.]|jgi:ferredoxin-NADP reductase|nr:hypothetical protein [Amycolatopsis sp.]
MVTARGSTREPENGWCGLRGRIDREFLDRHGLSPAEAPIVYVCGPTAFVEAVADDLVALGHEPGRIRTERFGGTGT